jgi:hypothetical protein
MTTTEANENPCLPKQKGRMVPAYGNACGYEGYNGKQENRSLLFASLEAGIFFLEFLNATRGINQFLFPCEIGMTGGTNLDLHLFIHRSEFDLIAASANSFDLIIFWMGIWLHDFHSL